MRSSIWTLYPLILIYAEEKYIQRANDKLNLVVQFAKLLYFFKIIFRTTVGNEYTNSFTQYSWKLIFYFLFVFFCIFTKGCIIICNTELWNLFSMSFSILISSNKTCQLHFAIFISSLVPLFKYMSCSFFFALQYNENLLVGRMLISAFSSWSKHKTIISRQLFLFKLNVKNAFLHNPIYCHEDMLSRKLDISHITHWITVNQS